MTLQFTAQLTLGQANWIRHPTAWNFVLSQISMGNHPLFWLVSRSQTLTPHAGEGLVNCNTRSCTAGMFLRHFINRKTWRERSSSLSTYAYTVTDRIRPHNKWCNVWKLQSDWRRPVWGAGTNSVYSSLPDPLPRACGVRVWLRETMFWPHYSVVPVVVVCGFLYTLL